MNKLALGCVSAALLAAPAFAQSTAPAPSSPPAQSNAQMAGAGSAQAMDNQQIANLWRASKLDGVNIYNNNNEKIGEIDDVLVDHNGKAMAVVVDVGGFLGIGTHRVALKFEDVKFMDTPRASASSGSTNTDRSAATTTTTSTANRANAPAGSPPTSVSADSGTRGSTASSSSSNRMYPDHAVLNMTKEQLKALPQVSYSR